MSSKFETSSTPFHNHKRRAKNPSFSSILLDTIYRSIDDDNHHHHHHDHSHSHSHGYYPRTTPTSPTHNNIVKHRDYDDIDIHASDLVLQRRTKMRSDSTLETLDLRRAIMIESWIEKHPPQQKSQQKMHFDFGDNLNDQTVRIIRQKSVPNSRAAPAQDDNLSSTSSCFTNLAQRSSSREQSSSRIFTKTKSCAMKMYCDLKKSKSQTTPISPGRRIAAFLNSIFRNPSNSSTPAKTSPENPPRPLSTTSSNSSCSTGSSFSRSCLSNKTSSSSSKSTLTTTKTKRSVKFYPVSVILDEDSRPCGHKALHNNDENQGFKKLVSPRPVNGRGEVEQSKWRREKEIDALMKMINANNKKVVRHHSMDEEEEEEDDDNGSCGSSDLFELENLSSIGGVSRYYEELPVYGTTSLKNITV